MTTRANYIKTLLIDHPASLPADMLVLPSPHNADSPDSSDELIRMVYQDASKTWQTFLSLYGDGSLGDSTNPVGGVTLADTTTSTTGILFKGTNRFLHNFHHPTGDSAVPAGLNTFLGIDAGNFTLGSTATSTAQGSYNTGVGESCLFSLEKGYRNTAMGWRAMYNCTDGYMNSVHGRWACFSLTSGYQNSCIGNTALYGITSGYDLVAVGNGAGRYIAGGSTPNETSNSSIYIGADSKALADGGTNEIVIGHDCTGKGDNSVVIGNDSLANTYLKGNITLSEDSNAAKMQWVTETEEVTIAAAASTTSTIQFPAGSFGTCSAIVTTVIPTAATWDMGITGQTTVWGSGLAVAATTSNDGYSSSFINVGTSAIGVTITPNTPPAAATGKVRIKIGYWKLSPPTS